MRRGALEREPCRDGSLDGALRLGRRDAGHLLVIDTYEQLLEFALKETSLFVSHRDAKRARTGTLAPVLRA